MSAPAALIPVAPYWNVKIGVLGITFGSFTKPDVDRFAASYGNPAGNFVIPVRPPEEAEQQMTAWLASQEQAAPEPTKKEVQQ